MPFELKIPVKLLNRFDIKNMKFLKSQYEQNPFPTDIIAQFVSKKPDVHARKEVPACLL